MAIGRCRLNSWPINSRFFGPQQAAFCTVQLALGAITCAELQSGIPLSTDEIREAFSGVRDDAIVQDAEGTRAVNYWCADGTFVSEWSNGSVLGRVAGRWWALDDQRCVVIVSGPEELVDTERCGPVLRSGEQYLSVDPDGSIHGIHTLSPMPSGDSGSNCGSSTKELPSP